eukprot:scaffold107405_cov30-Tisochrysis_lutea.AAC.3
MGLCAGGLECRRSRHLVHVIRRAGRCAPIHAHENASPCTMLVLYFRSKKQSVWATAPIHYKGDYSAHQQVYRFRAEG